MRPITLALAGALASAAALAAAQDQPMSFFVTSANPGKGADLGGLEGADAHCAALAEAAGVAGRSWAAYLSTSEVDARDRIGAGPWTNAAGVVVAENVEALHSDANNLTKETALTETGEVVKGRGDEPNMHDILTGTLADGTKAPDTCGDWTLSGAEGAAMVGHSDRRGPETLPTGTSWNAAHNSRGGCSMEALEGTGGAGLFYCFAVD